MMKKSLGECVKKSAERENFILKLCVCITNMFVNYSIQRRQGQIILLKPACGLVFESILRDLRLVNDSMNNFLERIELDPNTYPTELSFPENVFGFKKGPYRHLGSTVFHVLQVNTWEHEAGTPLADTSETTTIL